MLSTESGVIPGSDYYIYTPSTQAESLFLYPINVGYFRYRPGYCLRRDSYDSFLIMYMRKGGCEIEINGRHYHAAADQVVVLDCYGPHCYHTSTGWDAEWLHFDGPGARGYFDAIVENGNPVITLKDHYRLEKDLHKIYMQFKDRAPVKEAILNNYIVNILTELLIGRNSEHPVSISSSIIEDIVAFINEHLTDPLTLEDLAAEVSLSPFYFSRLFKRETEMCIRDRACFHLLIRLFHLLKQPDKQRKQAYIPFRYRSAFRWFPSSSSVRSKYSFAFSLLPSPRLPSPSR